MRSLHHQDPGRGAKSCGWRHRHVAGGSAGQIVAANGFTSESDYDSDDLPKGPYADGGGEADTPQHCDGCGQFLENPLTGDGLIYVEDALRDCLRTKKLSSATNNAVVDWAEFYKDELDFRRIVREGLKE